MLFLEATSQVALFGSLIVLLLVFISCISAKRFNFLHGIIVFFTLLSLIVGIDQILVTKDLISTNEVAKNVHDYFGMCSVLGLPLFDALTDFLKAQSFYPNIESYMYLIYFAPILLWLVSRLISGMFRKKRRKY